VLPNAVGAPMRSAQRQVAEIWVVDRRVKGALAALARGRPVVVVDRDGGGDLMYAAELLTPERVAFAVRHTSGYLCVALVESDADRLGLPPLVPGQPHAVAVDARQGTGTGISAHDRARTARRLADPSTVASDLSRPGHIVPLRAQAGGSLVLAGRAEAATDLARLAGLRPAVLLGAIVSENEPARMAHMEELAQFAAHHSLCVIGIEELVKFQRSRCIERMGESRVLLRGKQFRCVRYRDADGLQHLALAHGDVGGAMDVLVRVHSECLPGDVFETCGCGARLRESVAAISSQGRGLLLYLREGVKDSAEVVAGILDQHGVESLPPLDWGSGAALSPCDTL
jgi:3,4-dihydroxy 2-butanone 4-phosphate synthase/GTP cyclohydrolase II